MPKIRLMLALVASLLVGGCAPAAFFAINVPAKLHGQPEIANVAYGPDGAQKLDIYLPAKSIKNAPVVVFLYGGRWKFGAKEDYAFVGRAFAAQGFIAVIPDYRKYPDVKFPVFIQDAADALTWTSAHISKHGGDAKNIFLSGHSAGAHMASLIVSDKRYMNGAMPVRAFAGLAGPYDFIPDEPDLKKMFGPPENYPNMQATTFITGAEPPMLLLHGADDETVKASNLEKLAAKIREKGGKVTTRIYPGLTHTQVIGTLSWALSAKAPVLADMVSYFRSHRAQ